MAAYITTAGVTLPVFVVLLVIPWKARPRMVGALVVTNLGVGATDEAIALDAITNRPVLPPVVPFCGLAINGIQNGLPVPLVLLVVQETATLVTSAEPTLPDPSLTVQVSPLG